MFGQNKKTSYKRFIYSPLFLLFLFLILILLLKALWGVYQKEGVSSNYLNREQAELDKLNTREKELTQSVEYLKTDKGVEAEIRSKFRVAKEGEHLAVIIDDNKATTSVKTSPDEGRGFWGSLLHFISFGKL